MFLFLALCPGVAAPACEVPDYHIAPPAGWCAGIGGFADADYATPGVANELVMVERAFSGSWYPGSSGFAIGLDLGYRNYEVDEEIGANLDLYQFSLRPQWRVKGEVRDWLLRLAATRAVSSNRAADVNWHADEMFYSSAAIARQALDDRRTLVYGAAYDYSFGKAALYPVAGVELDLTPHWQLALIVPFTRLHWDGGGRWAAQFRLYPAGRRWRVLDSDTGRDFDTFTREFRLSAELHWRLDSRWQLVATLAGGFNRSLTTSAANGSRLAADVDPAPFGAIGLRYRSGRN
ncbi:MAG: hypothetical protein HKO55_08285 [Gammaproteobacteria bacterium]|nr:hypothetical protein [Gammaproteobacteria bacterium]NNM21251.1 hypothetical protein [Gammaproteobacteria bacterium]